MTSAVRTSAAAGERRSRVGRLAMRVLVPSVAFVLVVGLWQVGLFHSIFGLEEYTVPYPRAIAELIREDWPDLWSALEVTLREAAIGYAIGNAAGLGIAIGIVATGRGRRTLTGVAGALNAIPIVAIAPVSTLYFGFGAASKIAVVVVMTAAVMLLHAYKGLSSADSDSHDLVYSYAATRTQTMIKLRIPHALPFLFTALKYNVTLALVGAIIAEFFGGYGGVGIEMVQALAAFEMPRAWAYMILVGALGITWFQSVALIERATTGWHSSFREMK